MRRIWAIAITTFRESVRSKILYTVFVFALTLVLAATFFGSVSIGSRDVVVKNFGIFAISLFTVAFACISGASLLSKELYRRTVFTVLSKPLRRWEFLVGKYAGMLMTVTMMILIMGLALSLFSAALSGHASSLLLEAYFLIWLELVIICAAAIFFSSIVVTPLLSGLFAFGIFLAGRSASYILYFVREGKLGPVLSRLLDTLYWLVPHLDFFETTNALVYGIPLSGEYLVWSAVYAFGYAAVLLCLATLIFMQREFNK